MTFGKNIQNREQSWNASVFFTRLRQIKLLRSRRERYTAGL